MIDTILSLAHRISEGEITLLEAEKIVIQKYKIQEEDNQGQLAQSEALFNHTMYYPASERFYIASLNTTWREQLTSDYDMTMAQSHYQSGHLACEIGLYHQAVSLLEKCKEYFEYAYEELYPSTLRYLGVAYRNLLQYDKAMEIYKEAERIALENNDKQALVKVYGNLGVVYQKLEQTDQAIEYHKVSLEMAKELQDRLSEGKELANLGNIYRDKGEWEKALEYHKVALNLCKEGGGNESAIAKQLANIATIYLYSRKLEIAFDYYHQALSIWERIGNKRDLSQVLGNLALISRDLKKIPQAIDYMEQSLKIAHEAEYPMQESGCLGNLGNFYSLLGETQKAFKYTKKAYEIAQKYGLKKGVQKWLSGLGIYFENLGDIDQGMGELEKALALSREIQDEMGEGIALGNMGKIYADHEDFPKALEYYERAIKLALKTRDIVSEGIWLKNIAYVYEKLGDISQSRAYYEQAISVNQEAENREGHWLALFDFGRHLYTKKNYDEAYSYLKKSLELLENLRENLALSPIPGNFIEDKMISYQYMVACCLLLGRYEEAWQWAEKARARFLMFHLASYDLQPKESTPIALREEYQKICQSMKKLQYIEQRRLESLDDNPDIPRANPKKIQNLQNSMEKVLEQIRKYDPEFLPVVNIFFPSLQEIQQTIPEGTCIVEFFITQLTNLIFLIGRDTFEIIDTISLKASSLQKIYHVWQDAYKNLQERNISINIMKTIDSVMQEISEAISSLFQTESYKKANHIVIVPHRELQMLPLHLLRNHGVFMFEEKKVSYTPNAKIWADVRRRTQYSKTTEKVAAVVTDPHRSIRFIYPETDALIKILGCKKEQLHLLQDSEASCSNVLNAIQYAAYIIFSCHGKFSNDLCDSGLLLLKNEILSLIDIFVHCSVQNCRLVILSACETGVSEVKPSSEYISIANVFLCAGAQNVLATLWPVDNLTSYLLNIRFLANYIKNGDAAESLRNSQTWLRNLTGYQIYLYLEAIAKNSSNPDFWQRFDTLDFSTKGLPAPSISLNQITEMLTNLIMEANPNLSRESTRKSCKDVSRQLVANLEQKIFESPWYWAGFYLVS